MSGDVAQRDGVGTLVLCTHPVFSATITLSLFLGPYLTAFLVLQVPHCHAMPEPAAKTVPKDAAHSLLPAPSGLTSQSLVQSCALFQKKPTPFKKHFTLNLALFLLHPRKIMA